jgi:hypothetical protein
VVEPDRSEEWVYGLVAAWIVLCFLRALLDGLMML